MRLRDKIQECFTYQQWEEALPSLATVKELKRVESQIKKLGSTTELFQQISRVEDDVRRMCTKEMLKETEKEFEKVLKQEYLPLLDINDRFDERDFQIKKCVQQNEDVLLKMEEVTKQASRIEEELEHKCDDRQILEIKREIKRFALYDDLKDLYNKVVPPCQTIQENLEEYLTQLAKFERMLAAFDEGVQLRALKTELNPLWNEFKHFVKTSQHMEAVSKVERRLKDQEKSLMNLQSDVDNSTRKNQDIIFVSLRNVEQKLDRRLKRSLKEIPGYNPASIASSLGLSGANTSQEAAEALGAGLL